MQILRVNFVGDRHLGKDTDFFLVPRRDLQRLDPKKYHRLRYDHPITLVCASLSPR